MPDAFLALEAIGHDDPCRSRPWVAAITGRDSTYGLMRAFVRPAHTDYARANSVGSRGVYLIYQLPPGVYEVSAPKSWRERHRYYLHVRASGAAREISREHIAAYLDGLPLDPPAYYVP